VFSVDATGASNALTNVEIADELDWRNAAASLEGSHAAAVARGLNRIVDPTVELDSDAT